MTASPVDQHLPALPGFDRECKALIFAMVESGWTGRITSKRHWFGKAPDGKATITVPSKYGQNRGLANAEAQFMRWLKQQMGSLPDGTPIIETARTGNPVVDGIVREGFVKHAISKLPPPVMNVVKREPWLARRNAKRGGGIRYESEAVIQRTWNNGDVDFECAFEGCDYASDKPRSVANHYGAAHTQKGEAEPAQNGPLHVDPEYTEPASTREYRPTQRLVDALAEFMESTAMIGSWDSETLATSILTWFHDRPDIEHESRPLVPLTDKDVLNRIRVLVGTPDPDQTAEIEALYRDNAELIRQRDEANAHLVKVQRDLDGIKELMEGVGR